MSEFRRMIMMFTRPVESQVVPSPTISPASGSILSSQTITISIEGIAVSAEYSLDNSTWIAYTGPFILQSSSTIFARAKDANNNYSQVVSATYTLLPYDAQVEYLQSSGTQWIDTGIYGNVNTKVLIQFCPSENSNVVFGSRTSATSNSFTILVGTASDKKLFADFGNYQNTRVSYSFPSITGHWYEVINSKNLRKITDLNTSDYIQHTTLYSNSFTTPRTLKIFLKEDEMPSAYMNFKGKISICKIYDNDVLIIDLIPVRVGQVGYMYDRVNGQLFGNSGTGSFTLGNDITT